MRKYFVYFAMMGAVALSGCTIDFNLGSSASKGPDGGVYKSATKGSVWQQKSLIPTTSGKPSNISALNANALVMDPTDSNTLYFAAADNGLFYTYDGGENWWPVNALKGYNITTLAVDPKARCTIYAASANRLLKTSDCGRSWLQTYYDNELDVAVTSIAIDQYDSQLMYIGTSRGDIIFSADAGKTWRALNRFDHQIKKIMISPADSRLMFVATVQNGLFRSDDRGQTWHDLKETLKKFDDSDRFRDLYLSRVRPGLMILATNYGLLKSVNNGDDWTALILITPEKEATINSVVVSETNPEEIYYVTNTTFYGSADGGNNWATKKLPSNRAGRTLIADPNQAGVLYLAVRQLN